MYFPCKDKSKFFYSIILIRQPTTTIISRWLLTVTFSHCSRVPQSFPASIPSSIFMHFQSTNQSPGQFTSDSNLASIALLIPAASCSGGRMQRKERGGETKPSRHRCAVSQP